MNYFDKGCLKCKVNRFNLDDQDDRKLVGCKWV